MARALIRRLAGSLLLAVCGAASAMGPAAPFAAPMARKASTVGATSDTAPIQLTGVRLGAAPSALIDGRWLPQGAEVRGLRIERVSPSAVSLRHADGRLEALLLFPPQPQAAASAASAPNAAISTDKSAAATSDAPIEKRALP